MKIKVIIKRTDSKPYSTNISDTIENLEKTVGGPINTVGMTRDIVVICNGEARPGTDPYNCTVRGCDFIGDIIVAGIKGQTFTDLPLDFADMKHLLPDLWKE